MTAFRLFGRPLPIHFALLGRKRKYIKSKTTAKLTEKRTSIAAVRDILWTFGTFPTPLLSRYPTTFNRNWDFLFAKRSLPAHCLIKYLVPLGYRTRLRMVLLDTTGSKCVQILNCPRNYLIFHWYNSCAAKAYYYCPSMISRRPRSQNTSKERALNPEKESSIKRPRSHVSLEKSS